MMSCILSVYIPPDGRITIWCSMDEVLRCTTVVMLLAGTLPGAAQPRDEADALYAHREDLASARQAEAIWAERLLRDPRDFEAAWKLARARYWLGGHAPNHERRALLESGIESARAAVAIHPQRPEGHFWVAANMGGLAESFGMRVGLKHRGEIKENLLRVLTLDPAFQQGSADRGLGRWYFKVPSLFGGSKKKSEEHLRRSLTYAPDSTASLFFLAETLLALRKPAEARATLQKLAVVPGHPEWAPEDREFKDKGRRLLETLR
jgi:hypothetical protein